jgi:hypothetical protein
MIDIIKPLIKQFMPFAQERMGFKDPPRLFVRRDEQNAGNPLGKTAYYDPSAKSVTIYISGRHPKDVMRSLSHELVHHTQNCNGEFENVGEMGEGYAQNDSHLREMERQAYEIGNLCFRDWEDSVKQTIYFEHLQKGVEKVMSIKKWKNNEIKSLLSEAWGFKMDLNKLNEDIGLAPEQDEEDVVGGCGDHSLEDDEVVVMQNADDGAPDDPNALVDELGDIVGRLQAALGGLEGGVDDEIVVDMAESKKRRSKKAQKDFKESLRRALKKALMEAGGKTTAMKARSTGKTMADLDADAKRRETDPRAPAKKKPEAGAPPGNRHHKIKEDSGEKEDKNYDTDEMSDDDHIKAIEHHLDALRGDRDYDDEHIEERRRRGRKGPSTRGIADPGLREAIEKALKASIKRKKA